MRAAKSRAYCSETADCSLRSVGTRIRLIAISRMACSSGFLRPGLEAEQHLSLHQEVNRIEQHHLRRSAECGTLLLRMRPDEEPCGVVVDGPQNERAPAVQNEVVLGLAGHDAQQRPIAVHALRCEA